jgi:hypothetical protein
MGFDVDCAAVGLDSQQFLEIDRLTLDLELRGAFLVASMSACADASCAYASGLTAR